MQGGARSLVPLAIGAVCALLALLLVLRSGPEREHDAAARESAEEQGAAVRAVAPVAPVGEDGRRGEGRTALSPVAAGAAPAAASAARAEEPTAREALPFTAPPPPEPPPLRWSGVVRDERTGAPIRGARATLAGEERASEDVTGEDGAFELVWREGLEGTLTVAHERYVDLTVSPARLDRPGELRMTRSASVVGVLVPPPARMEGVRAVLWRQEGRWTRDWERVEAEPDARGAFRFDDLAPGDYGLSALGTQEIAAWESGLRLESGEERLVEVALGAGVRVTGRVVVRGTGEPVAGAEVKLEPELRRVPPIVREVRERRTTTDHAGLFALAGVAPGTARVDVSSPWGGRRRTELDVRGGGVDEVLEVELPGPASIEGVVLDADGGPVPDAWVRVGVNARSMDMAKLLAGDANPQPGPTLARTGSTGTFRLEQVPAGARLVVAAAAPSAESGPLTASETVGRLEPGELRSGVELRLPRTLTLHGTVTTREGVPIVGEELRVHTGDGRERTLHARVESDEDGAFEVEGVPEGTVQVRAGSDLFLPWRKTFELAAPAEEPLRIFLEPARALVVRTVEEDGYAVGRVRVLIEPTEDAVLPKGLTRKQLRRVGRTDEEGRVSFLGIHPVAWRATVLSDLWELGRSEPEVVPAGHEWDGVLELELRPRDRDERVVVHGVAVRADTGGAPAGLWIGGLGGGTLEVDGERFRATGVAPGQRRLRVVAEGMVSVLLGPLELTPGTELDLGLLELEPGGEIAVRVTRKASGKAVGKAGVRALALPVEQGGPDVQKRGERLSHTSGGLYEGPVLTPGRWRVRVDLAGAKPWTRVVEVPAGGRVELEAGL
jgi:hypothetical protein